MQTLPIKKEDVRKGDWVQHPDWVICYEVISAEQSYLLTDILGDCFKGDGPIEIGKRNGKEVVSQCPKKGDKVELADLLPGDEVSHWVLATGTAFVRSIDLEKEVQFECGQQLVCTTERPLTFISRKGIDVSSNGVLVGCDVKEGIENTDTEKESRENIRGEVCHMVVADETAIFDLEQMKKIARSLGQNAGKSYRKMCSTTLEGKDSPELTSTEYFQKKMSPPNERANISRDEEILEHICNPEREEQADYRDLFVPVEMFQELLGKVDGLPDVLILNDFVHFKVSSGEFKKHGEDYVVSDGKGGFKVEGT